MCSLRIDVLFLPWMTWGINPCSGKPCQVKYSGFLWGNYHPRSTVGIYKEWAIQAFTTWAPTYTCIAEVCKNVLEISLTDWNSKEYDERGDVFYLQPVTYMSLSVMKVIFHVHSNSNMFHKRYLCRCNWPMLNVSYNIVQNQPILYWPEHTNLCNPNLVDDWYQWTLYTVIAHEDIFPHQ